MIKKIKEGYRVYSLHNHRNMGTYKTKKAAIKRLKQIEMFKHLRMRR
jgi:hypothetical protein